MSSIDLGRTLQKLLAAFHTFQHFSPEGNRNRCIHIAALLTPSWEATHTAGRCSLKGFHTVNVRRYRLPVLHTHLHRAATCPTLLPLRYVLKFPGKKNQSSTTLVVFVLFGCYLCCSMYFLCVNVYCHQVTTQLQLINISISIKWSAHIVTHAWGSTDKNRHLGHKIPFLVEAPWPMMNESNYSYYY